MRISEGNTPKYVNNGNRYPELPAAIETAAYNGTKKLKELRNFEEGWDLQRLVFLVGLLKNHAKSPLRHANEVHAELESWNKGRNAKAHDSIPGTDRKLYTDGELEVLIGKAKVLLPRINGWEKNSEERRRIDDRLNALQACLDGEDVPPPPKNLYKLTKGPHRTSRSSNSLKYQGRDSRLVL
jgi:hypothetical protein